MAAKVSQVKQDAWAQMTPEQRRAANQAQGGGGKKPAKPGAPSTGAQAPQTPENMFHEVYDTSHNQVNNDNYQAGSQFVRDNLQNDNFEGTNQYMANLGNQVGQADFNEPLTLLRDFLGVGQGGSYGGGSGGNNRVAGGTVRANYAVDGNGNVSFPAAGGSGNVPDTVGNSNSFFAQHTRDLFDPSRLDPANDPTMQPYLDTLNAQAAKAFAKQKSMMDAQSEGSGRFGGGMYQNMSALAAGENSAALQAQLASTLFGSRKEALDRQMEGLGMTNQRDIAAMQDATQRYGIDSAASSAGAGSAAMSADAKRSQDLQAIGMLMGQQQFGLSTLGDVGKSWQAQQMGSLGAIPGLENANQGYIAGMNSGATGLANMQLSREQMQNQIRQSQIAAGPARQANQLAQQQFAWNQQIYNSPEAQMQRWAQMMGQLGGMGGATWGQGPAPPQVIMPGSMGGAAAGGAVGGGMAGAGMGG